MSEVIGDLSKDMSKYTAIIVKKPIGLDIKEIIKVQKVDGKVQESKKTTDYDE